MTDAYSLMADVNCLVYRGVDDAVAEALRVVRRCRDLSVVWRVKRLVGEFLNGDIDLSTFYTQLSFIREELGIRDE